MEQSPVQRRSISALAILREWCEALVTALILVMFVRVFIMDLFKIPSGSMSPTLIGDYIADVDWDHDGQLDLVVRGHDRTQVYLRRGDHYEVDESARVGFEDLQQWEREGILKSRNDRILVNKFAFWFSPPRRGDIIVFKVPLVIWDPDKPFYIKRVAGGPGDTISFDGQLHLDGKALTDPSFFSYQRYDNRGNFVTGRFPKLPYVHYGGQGYSRVDIVSVDVPDDAFYVLGDNVRSSLDSRYWGAVPLENAKGKAFMRYWPLTRIKFLR